MFSSFTFPLPKFQFICECAHEIVGNWLIPKQKRGEARDWKSHAPVALCVRRDDAAQRSHEIKIDILHLLSSHLARSTLTSSQCDFDAHIQLVQSMLEDTCTEVIDVSEATVVPWVHAVRKINPAVNPIAARTRLAQVDPL